MTRQTSGSAGRAWMSAGAAAESGATTNEIRESFLEYFNAQHDHPVVPGSPVVPVSSDKSLLFTNAGMVQFKDRFLGARPEDGNAADKCATSAQPCIRAGGKHNDLDEVGRTPRHHTMFEMLGNFSFASYGKAEAIRMAWRYLTRELALDEARLSVSVHHTDEESAALWRQITGISDTRIARLGDEDNFWSMGDTGPCGRCTEIFWEHDAPSIDGETLLEVWNLVFMEQDRTRDPETGQLVATPLPAISVDTGMGLERIASVVQGTTSNYATDVFRGIIGHAEEVMGRAYGGPDAHDPAAVAHRVVADHVRTLVFLIKDGVIPGNTGRAYVARRILRRAVLHAHTSLGVDRPCLAALVPAVAAAMGTAYPALADPQLTREIAAVVDLEERLFRETIERGLTELEAAIADTTHNVHGTLAGTKAFQLYDTYGFPLDLTVLIADKHGVAVDVQGYQAAMDAQQERSREGSSIGGTSVSPVSPSPSSPPHGTTAHTQAFVGYTTTHVPHVRILQAHPAAPSPRSSSRAKGKRKSAKGAAPEWWLVMDPCPFYATGGGQVADTGLVRLSTENGKVEGGATLSVVDVQRTGDDVIAVRCRLAGAGSGAGDDDAAASHVTSLLQDPATTAEAVVDGRQRDATAQHHTATHLLHAALGEVLADATIRAPAQAGSLVTPERLRFDFSTPGMKGALDENQLAAIEAFVNDAAQAALPVEAVETSYETAVNAWQAKCLFDEKYGDEVRVVRIADLSTELCGGTHVSSTDAVYPFMITGQTAIGSGVRRLEAVAGTAATRILVDAMHAMREVAGTLLQNTPQTLTRGPALIEKVVTASHKVAEERAQLGAICDAMAHALVQPAALGPNDHTFHLGDRGDGAGDGDSGANAEPIHATVHTLSLSDLGLDPESARSGVGKKLLPQMLREAAQNLRDRDGPVIVVCEQRIVCASTPDGPHAATCLNAYIRHNNQRGGGGGDATFAQGSIRG